MDLGDSSSALFLPFSSQHIHRIYIFLIPPQQSKTVFLRMKHNKNIKYAPVKTEYCGPCCLSFTVARSEATLLCFCSSRAQRGFFVLACDGSYERGSLGPRCLLPALCARAARTAPMQPVTWNQKPEDPLFFFFISNIRDLAGQGCDKLGSNFIFKVSRGWDCKNKRKKLPKNGDTASLNLVSRCHSPAQNNHQKFPKDFNH